MNRMRRQLRSGVAAVWGSFWFIPALLSLAFAALAQTLVSLDSQIDISFAESLLGFETGVSGARDILTTIGGSMLTVAGTVFSITMAVLALTSSTFGPRLVRSFMSDRGNQAFLGLLIATFIYCLLVLRSIRGDVEAVDASRLVPVVAVNVAFVLAVACVAALIWFVHHISTSIEVWTLAKGVAGDLMRAIDREFPAQARAAAITTRVAVPEHPEQDRVLWRVSADADGYVRLLDVRLLRAVAGHHDARVHMCVRPGDYVLRDTVVSVIDAPRERGDERDLTVSAVRSAVAVGFQRSPEHDVRFAVRQVLELGVRALSPGTNDPYTALNALDHLSAGLALAATRDRGMQGATVTHDGRLHLVRTSVCDLLGMVCEAVRHYAVSHPVVVRRAMEILGEVGRRGDGDVVVAVAGHLDRIAAAFDATDAAGADRAAVAAARSAARAALV